MKIKDFILKLLFPPRCSFCNRVLGFVPECEKCSVDVAKIKRETGSAIVKERHELTFIATALAPYEYKAPVKGAILRLKFAGRTDLAKNFASDIFAELKACNTLPDFDIIIAVPSGKKELRRRGYDVPDVLAKELSALSGIRYVKNVLSKPVDTRPQMKLSGDARRANLLGAFSVAMEEAVIGKKILLVDDVITTGATLNECAKTTLIAGALSCCSVCVAVAVA